MGLPDWVDPLYEAAEMRAVDAWAIEEQGVPSLDLMERAGIGLARLTAELALPGRPVRVVVGKGNNGGDGLVVARLLREEGREVDVLITGDPADLKGDALANLQRLPGAGPEPFDPNRLEGSGAIVDAMLGTGFEGEPREPVLGAIEAINAADAPVVAADVASGVDASTGEVAGAAVRAVATATFAAAKPGLWIEPGKTHTGDVHVVDIGIPRGAPGEAQSGLIRAAVLDEIPRRQRGSTKFDSGHVLVCGGSPGLTGAPCLAADAAMRAGAGYVTACVPTDLSAIFETRLLEVMTAALEVEEVVDRAQRGGACVVGPGMGRLSDAEELARELARRAELPLVLDADGLNAHAGRLEELAQRSAPTVL